jgi:hypothetical protein
MIQGRSSDLGLNQFDAFSANQANGIRRFVHLTALGTLRSLTTFPILQLVLAPCQDEVSAGVGSKQVLK